MIDKAPELARMGCLYCRLAFELPTQARQLGRQATRVLLMVMEPPRVPLMMMEPPTSLVPGVSACRLSLVLHLLGGANSDKALIN